MGDSGVCEGVKDGGVWEHHAIELCSVKCEPSLRTRAVGTGSMPTQVKVSQVGKVVISSTVMLRCGEKTKHSPLQEKGPGPSRLRNLNY